MNYQTKYKKLIRAIRKSLRYDTWRKAIKKRDKYRCQECGCKERFLLEAHHEEEPFSYKVKRLGINSVKEAEDTEELWNIDKGKTLCLYCHQNTDGYGFKKRM
jgi:hypothetical protein